VSPPGPRPRLGRPLSLLSARLLQASHSVVERRPSPHAGLAPALARSRAGWSG
jgi:hypothetical protein